MEKLVLFLVISIFIIGCQTGEKEDVVGTVSFVGPTLQADINGDGIVDANDIKIMASEWGKEQIDDEGFRSDFNNDGIVDLKDLAVMADHWLEEK
ncbi:hypothetical protein LCGC14_1317960 [marine sediment metagenome]|uniref:Dockerin domain-containing protein n=1 Tax=marine sediment metagenome TaxID=412755 RepID=A0A0F9N190_9ZZZZ